MTTTTALPKLTWKQFLAIHDEKAELAQARRAAGQEPQSWTTSDVASNHDAITIVSLIYFRGFRHLDPELWSDPAVRADVIELLTEDGYAAAHPDRMRHVQASN